MAELDPLQLLPDPSQVLALDAALDRARRRLDLGGLRVAFAAKAPQLKDLLPDLLDDAALDGGGLRAALAALDPAPLREEINTLFDSFGARLVGMQGALNAALDDIGQLVEAMFLPVTPGRLVAFASDLHAGLKAHVAAVGPEAFRDELEPLFTAVRKQAAALDVGRLAEDLNAERDALIASIEDLVLAVLPDPAPFRELQVRLAALKPSQLLTEVAVQLTALTESIGRLDPDLLFVPLVEAMARIRNQIPEVIAKIEEAFDAVLAALPSGSGASASVSASASVGGSVGGS
jgi:hypothetical protein